MNITIRTTSWHYRFIRMFGSREAKIALKGRVHDTCGYGRLFMRAALGLFLWSMLASVLALCAALCVIGAISLVDPLMFSSTMMLVGRLTLGSLALLVGSVALAALIVNTYEWNYKRIRDRDRLGVTTSRWHTQPLELLALYRDKICVGIDFKE